MIYAVSEISHTASKCPLLSWVEGALPVHLVPRHPVCAQHVNNIGYGGRGSHGKHCCGRKLCDEVQVSRCEGRTTTVTVCRGVLCKQWLSISLNRDITKTLCSVKGGRRRGADPSTHYSATVQLPRTSLPFRVSAANRAQLEASVQQAAGFDSLYAWQRGQNREKEFVLHDGPPYANGRPHIGHAVNKILKDITLRQKLLQGYKVHYIPGWDCHGLPIELKATQVDKKKKTPANQLSSYSDPLEIRNNAQRFAKEALEIQRSVFQRWGLLADWSEVYRTLDPQYVTRQLHLFIDLYEKGFIYQDYKPVYFSPNLGTSLAEAELEYEPQHVSPFSVPCPACHISPACHFG
ncbi:hypothetical protein O3P69_020200 [Scylla paramamosain]|uniref:Aminoacyl-tRNA synthetase class Ia domain-containing protein n=1 Tax=Scylla paramamosain TaxID=85552 RepID=A0AAW0TKC9_SCYPA